MLSYTLTLVSPTTNRIPIVITPSSFQLLERYLPYSRLESHPLFIISIITLLVSFNPALDYYRRTLYFATRTLLHYLLFAFPTHSSTRTFSPSLLSKNTFLLVIVQGNSSSSVQITFMVICLIVITTSSLHTSPFAASLLFVFCSYSGIYSSVSLAFNHLSSCIYEWEFVVYHSLKVLCLLCSKIRTRAREFKLMRDSSVTCCRSTSLRS